MTFNRWCLAALGCCILACVPYAAIRFVEWQIDVQSRGRFDDEETR